MSERTRSALLWAGCFAALFLYMYLRHGYVFPFIEQNRMFMWDGGWILRRAAECGGAAAVVRDFLLQFFVEPWSGALIAALLLVKTGVATQWTLGRAVPDNGALLLWLAPVATQMFLMVDYDYRYEGIVAWLAAWGLFSLFVRVGGGAAVRAVAASAAAAALYWLAGPAAIAFAATLFVYESVRGGNVRLWYLLPVAAAHGARYYMQEDTRRFEYLDYLMRRGAWDEVIGECAAGGTGNTLHCFMLNTALLERDELAERAFAFPQAGLEGLSIDWSDNNPFLFPLLSDMYYAIGNLSIAQETAFKKNSEALAVNGSCNPRMLLRLVQTAVAAGGHSGYATAGKYISMLEHTLFYRREASAYRRFLGNDAAVEADTRLGALRANMANIAVTYAAERDASLLAGLRPNALAGRTVDHLLVGRLLNRDLEGFRAAVDGCRAGGVMPAAECYGEALLIYGAMTGRDMGGYGISEQTRRRFLAFQSFAAENYSRSDLAAIMRRTYGGTYMYYYMFAGEGPVGKR